MNNKDMPAYPEATHFVIINHEGQIEFSVARDTYGGPECEKHFLHEHINDAINSGVQDANKWVVRSAYVYKDEAAFIDGLNKATYEWTLRAAAGQCDWICADCSVSFPGGMPDECAHGHDRCTKIIKRDKLKAEAALAELEKRNV